LAAARPASQAAVACLTVTVITGCGGVRRQSDGYFATALGLGGRHGDAPLSGLLSTLENEVEALRETRDFVQSFVDGKITCAQFVAGPANGQPKDTDYEPEMGDLEDFLADILMPSGFGAPGLRTPRSRRRR
jgi:hypothetical protein